MMTKSYTTSDFADHHHLCDADDCTSNDKQEDDEYNLSQCVGSDNMPYLENTCPEIDKLSPFLTTLLKYYSNL